MALVQNFQEQPTDCQPSPISSTALKQNWNSSSSVSSSTPSVPSETNDGCFECNICLDSAYEPVVTLCGHLYCWPCIYKWIHSQRSPIDPTDAPKCPVCKSKIINSSIIPLYGRGNSRTEPGPEFKKPKTEPVIPRRPAALRLEQHQNLTHRTLGNYTPHSPQSMAFGGAAGPSSFFSPTVGVFGEMVFARMFGSAENLFPYPNSYQGTLVGSSPRIRRQEMEVEKSLNRVSIFLLCCFILCLLLF